MTDAPFLALDIGGTKTALAVADGTSARAQRTTFATERTGPDTLARLLREARRLLTDRRPEAVGVSFGGHVVGRNVRSLHVPGWEDTDLFARLEREFQAPVRGANDAVAGAIGEHTIRARAGESWPVLVYVTVSTGIGGAILLDGVPYHGSHGLSGEIGHMVVSDTGLCSCGRTGHLEANASGLAIARRTAAEWLGAVEPQCDITARDVAEAARQGDPVAGRVLFDAGRLVGDALASTAALIDPDLIVVGGGVSLAGPAFWTPLIEAVAEKAMSRVRIDHATHGADSALWGAFDLARQAAEESLVA